MVGDTGRAGSDMEAWLAELGIDPRWVALRGLPFCEEATELECVETASDGREFLLTPQAAAAWRRLRAAAQSDGVQLFVFSAFRSVTRQAELIRRKLDSGKPLDEILAVLAPPGYSEHHTGRAVDVGTPDSPALETEFERTEAFAWLQRRAGEFGFRLSYPSGNAQGYQYEPWHWCFVPCDAAAA